MAEWAQACWAAVGGDAGAVEGLEVLSPDAWLGGPLDVDGLAVGAVGAGLLAAAELAEARGRARPAAVLSAEHVALSFRSERHMLAGGEPAGAGFAPLSRLVRCGDGGWARTHANYPHHAAALGRALGIEPGTDPGPLLAAASERSAEELEQAVLDAGGCAAALRTPAGWAAHPAGRAAGAGPLVEHGESHPGRPLELSGGADRPAAGIRVLDLTRVIAGPVAGRTLAALGADVLRIDPPSLPELPEAHLDTGAGKRSAVLDLGSEEHREALLAGADVLLVGYRPGALERFGLGAAEIAERHPQLVHVTLSAWGPGGPWTGRRGFDSLVQIASGIASACADGDGTPGVLPAQALDHATGHLMAAAALRGLAARARGAPIAPARLSLARTAAALLAASRPAEVRTEATGTASAGRHRVVFGAVSVISPPGALDGVALRWDHGPRPLGGDTPRWPPGGLH